MKTLKFIKINLSIIILLMIATAATVQAQTWSGSGSSTGNAYRSGNVGIGSTTSPGNLLYVENGTPASSVYTLLSGYGVSAGSIGILSTSNSGNGLDLPIVAVNNNDIDNIINLGVAGIIKGGVNNLPHSNKAFYAIVSGESEDDNTGYQALIGGSSIQNLGFMTQVTGPAGSIQNFGADITVTGSSSSTANNYGIDIAIVGDGGDVYGIYSDVTGLGTFNTAHAGYFDGNVTVTGTFSNPSDEKLKENIKDYDNAIEKINQLNVKQYTFRNEEYPYMALPTGEQVGLISSELKEVFPNLVKKVVHPKDDLKDEKKEAGVEYDAVNYIGLIPVLIQGVKELNEKVTGLESRNGALEQKAGTLEQQNRDLEKLLNDICASGCASFVPTGTLENSSAGQNRLFQNVPNPSGQQTEIAYTLDASVKSASIVVTDIKGTVIKRFDNLAQGNGKVIVSTEGLTAGVYSYSLFVNGNRADTKKLMVAAK